MNYMLMPLRRYADFSGRSRRKEYWLFLLFVFLASIALGILLGALGFGGAAAGATAEGLSGTALALVAVPALLLIVPSIAVQVRRFHDQDRSGWWVLVGLVPFIGGLVMLAFMVIPGTRGPNRFGPDPKAAHGDGPLA